MTALAYYCKKLNQSTSDPRINSSLHRKKMVSSNPHRLWAKKGGGWGGQGGLLHSGIREMVQRVSNGNLNGLGQHAKYFLMAQNSASKHDGQQSRSGCVRPGGQHCCRSLCPASSRGGSRAVGLHCLSGACRGAGLRTSSAPGSTHGPLTWEHPLCPRLPPNSLVLVKQLHSEAGSWVSKAAERVSNPDKTWTRVSIMESACFPLIHLHLVPKSGSQLLIWDPKQQSLSYSCSLPEVDLCSSQTLNFSVPWSLIGLLRGLNEVRFIKRLAHAWHMVRLFQFFLKKYVRD